MSAQRCMGVTATHQRRAWVGRRGRQRWSMGHRLQWHGAPREQWGRPTRLDHQPRWGLHPRLLQRTARPRMASARCVQCMCVCTSAFHRLECAMWVGTYIQYSASHQPRVLVQCIGCAVDVGVCVRERHVTARSRWESIASLCIIYQQAQLQRWPHAARLAEVMSVPRRQ